MSSIAALIITYNEEKNIRECLESINWCDEIVLVDSYSEDQTVAISREYTEKIYLRKFDDFAAQRNYALEKIESDWVLVIDADERVSGELRREIEEILNNNHVQAYQIPRKNYFLGKWIKYCGWYPDYTLRLFKNNHRLKYDGMVHEGIKIKGKINQLVNPLVHFTYKNLANYMNKINHYTTLWAEDRGKKGKKIGLMYIFFRPLFEFIKKYFLKKGVLLGRQGLILSILSSYYIFIRSAKLWEKNNLSKERKNEKDIFSK